MQPQIGPKSSLSESKKDYTSCGFQQCYHYIYPDL